MAERRMFSKKIVDSDAFLDMPLSTQALYFHLGMRADDDGFVSNPKRIRAMVGASEDDLKLLIAKRFLLTFDSGVVVIKHWKIHNYINPDRYTPTTYIEEKSTLMLDEKKAYTEKLDNGVVQNVVHGVVQNVHKMYTQVSIGKDSIELGKVSIGENKVSKKESNKKEIQSYDEIFEEFGVGELEKEAYLNFIRHLLVNHIVLINDRLQNIIIQLDMLFGNDEQAKVVYINDAISKGYKRLPCEE